MGVSGCLMDQLPSGEAAWSGPCEMLSNSAKESALAGAARLAKDHTNAQINRVGTETQDASFQAEVLATGPK